MKLDQKYQRIGLLFTPLIVTFTVRPARQNHAPPPCMSLDMYPIHLPHASRLQFHRCVVMLHMSDHHPETSPAAAMPGNFARVIANDCTAGPARPDPASSSPLAHWDPLGTWPAGNDARAALTRAKYGLQRGHSEPSAAVWRGLAVCSECAPRRAQGRSCSRGALDTEPRRTGGSCRRSLGALDAALCIRCLCSCISDYEARTASSELREAVRRAGTLMSAHLLQMTHSAARSRI